MQNKKYNIFFWGGGIVSRPKDNLHLVGATGPWGGAGRGVGGVVGSRGGGGVIELN